MPSTDLSICFTYFFVSFRYLFSELILQIRKNISDNRLHSLIGWIFLSYPINLSISFHWTLAFTIWQLVYDDFLFLFLQFCWLSLQRNCSGLLIMLHGDQTLYDIALCFFVGNPAFRSCFFRRGWCFFLCTETRKSRRSIYFLSSSLKFLIIC